MSLTGQFKTSPEVENEGVEFSYAPNEDGSVPSFRIARAGKSNKQFQAASAAAFKPFERAHKLGTLKPEQSEAIYMGVFIKTVLKGWSNVAMSDVTGNTEDKGFADFNHENARMLFTRLPELYDDLSDKSMAAGNFRDAELEETAGN
ncbi:tail chaperonine protein [Xanthomonas phage XAJ2]|uniref:Tail chaperonine protein n=1 Tax=Xanthomonas phage XAJ2 TaxID=1775249 RepID=A0A1I9L2E6_9CAUD|nr:tail chaperonine protein [Xanthomonas phage XAJ2]